MLPRDETLCLPTKAATHENTSDRKGRHYSGAFLHKSHHVENEIAMFSGIIGWGGNVERSCRIQGQCSRAMQGNAIAFEMQFNAATSTRSQLFRAECDTSAWVTN